MPVMRDEHSGNMELTDLNSPKNKRKRSEENNPLKDTNSH
jgi:hypothetical protein